MSVHTFGFLCALGLLAVPVSLSEMPDSMLPGPLADSATAVHQASDQLEIMEKHNALRRGVDPTASNMMMMLWNPEAAANAQKLADTCSLEHSTASGRKISTSECGENLYMSSLPNPWSHAVQAWYNEVDNWKYGVGSVNKDVVGNFTQVVWYNSNQIGCGMAFCPFSKYNFFYVCQYCPPGNDQFTHPYKSGPSCGDCPNSCVDKLCTSLPVTCTYTDNYSICPYLTKLFGCSFKALAKRCAASCEC